MVLWNLYKESNVKEAGQTLSEAKKCDHDTHREDKCEQEEACQVMRVGVDYCKLSVLIEILNP